MEQLLEQFFAWPQPGEADLDVFVWLQTSEFDHLAGQIDDLHWLSHIQNENLSSSPQSSPL